MKIVETEEAVECEKPAIEVVFLAEESALLRYAYGYVKRRELAEEVVQEAFMKLHQEWDAVEKPRPWLYRAVRNISLNMLRKDKREFLSDSTDLGEAEDRPDDQVGRVEAVVVMEQLMAEMGKNDRELVRLKFDEEMSYSAISEKLEIGVGNVGYRLHHVLKVLAEGLRRKGIDGYLK